MTNNKKPTSTVLKRYELIIAVSSLLAVFIANVTSLIIQYQQVKRLNELQVTIRDVNDLRESLAKPLEGVWDYKLEFAKFFGDKDKPYESNGKAIIIWHSAGNYYDVYIGYGIKYQWGTEDVVTGLISGTLRTDEEGWPEQPFELPMRYDHRTGKSGFERTITETFSFSNGSVQRDNSKKKAVRIILAYDDKKTTAGQVTLWR